VEMKPLAVNAPEGCGLTGLKRSTFLKLTYAGEIPSYKVGKNRLWRVRDLEEWVQKRAEASASEVA
jgi:excisionase family DNA binding protein